MRIVGAVYLLVHGICHAVGFLVPWKIITSKEEPYKTTLFAGALEAGDVGIRLIGVFWLLTSVAFLVTAWGSFASLPWWRGSATALAAISLVLCVLGLPGAKIGIPANLLLLAYLAVLRLGWLKLG